MMKEDAGVLAGGWALSGVAFQGVGDLAVDLPSLGWSCADPDPVLEVHDPEGFVHEGTPFLGDHHAGDTCR